MKVLMINASPHKNGSTYTALCEVGRALIKNSIDYEIFWGGKAPVISCTGCGNCKKTGRCFYDDAVNEIGAMLEDSDALVVGTPVHYAGASGMTSCIMGRLFMAFGPLLQYKPASAVVNARRMGASAALSEAEKFFHFNSMPVVSARYPAASHGSSPGESESDLEGMQAMRSLGENLAWLMKCIEIGQKHGVTPPVPEEKIKTDFIRDLT